MHVFASIIIIFCSCLIPQKNIPTQQAIKALGSFISTSNFQQHLLPTLTQLILVGIHPIKVMFIISQLVHKKNLTCTCRIGYNAFQSYTRVKVNFSLIVQKHPRKVWKCACLYILYLSCKYSKLHYVTFLGYYINALAFVNPKFCC